MKFYNFDLISIHRLLDFDDVCSTDNEYMSEANVLTHIPLNKPLYVIEPKKVVLFTTKLHYYRLRVENEINRHINTATDLLNNNNDQYLTMYVLKKTREAVNTLANDANSNLNNLDHNEDLWKDITTDFVIDSHTDRHTLERVVFYRYLIAELARCLLEMQGRYAYVIGQAGCYDVSLFYTSIVKRCPDKVFLLKRSGEDNKEPRKPSKTREDCCFRYDNEEYFSIAIQNFTDVLRTHHLIPNDYDVKKMEHLFSGRPCHTTFQWIGDAHFLTHIISGLTKEDHPVITTWPPNTPKWQVVKQRFVDKNNKPFTDNIRNEKERKGSAHIYQEAVDALKDYL